MAAARNCNNGTGPAENHQGRQHQKVSSEYPVTPSTSHVLSEASAWLGMDTASNVTSPPLPHPPAMLPPPLYHVTILGPRTAGIASGLKMKLSAPRDTKQLKRGHTTKVELEATSPEAWCPGASLSQLGPQPWALDPIKTQVPCSCPQGHHGSCQLQPARVLRAAPPSLRGHFCLKLEENQITKCGQQGQGLEPKSSEDQDL